MFTGEFRRLVSAVVLVCHLTSPLAFAGPADEKKDSKPAAVSASNSKDKLPVTPPDGLSEKDSPAPVEEIAPSFLKRAGTWTAGAVKATGRGTKNAGKATGWYLVRGVSTGGLGFVFRKATVNEQVKMASDHWTKSWYEKEAPFRFRQTPRYLWPYQWPVRIASKVITGEQHIATPGKGIADVVNRGLCSKWLTWLLGPLHLTKPAEFLLKAAPAVAGFVAITETANWGQGKYLEYRIQGPMAPFLDEELENNILMKHERNALKDGKLTREEARRRAYQLLKESERYFERIVEVIPKGNDPLEHEAFYLWSLNLLAFNDLKDLSEAREIDVDEDRYIYPLGFSPVVDDEQLQKLIHTRHSTMFRVRGAETLINEITKKSSKLKVDEPGRQLAKSELVQSVLQKMKDGKLSETEARKWIHVYLEWDQELKQMEILGFSKRSRENGEFTDRPLTLKDIEKDILEAIDERAKEKK